MKIAVVGCGALGSYYGAKLCRAGHDVHFVLRSDFAQVLRHGVQIRSVEGDFHVNPRCASAPGGVGSCDLVLIALKTTANAEFPNLLPPLVGPQTALLTLQNGLGNEEALARLFPVDHILGGLCFVCLNRIEPGLIHHLAHGRVVLGEFQRWPEPRTHDIATMFRHAGVPCSVTEDLARAHWEKLVWNIPFNGLGVAGAAGYGAVRSGRLEPAAQINEVLPTDRLLGDARLDALVRELMIEVIAAARGLGHPVDLELADKMIANTRRMGAYKASTLLDFERGQPLELESMFLEPLRRARSVGVETPRLEALCSVLEALAASRRG